MPANGKFYGWFALTGVMLVIFTVGGLVVHSYGVFLPVVSDHFGWSRGTLSLALSMGIMAFGLPSPVFGLIVARFGPRIPIIVGNLLAVVGIACLSFVQEIWHIYALYIFIGFSAGFGGYVACTSVVANWFVKKRPLALGLFTAFGGLGGLVFPPLATALIDVVDWRLAWAILAGIVAIIGVFIGGVLLTRNRPEDKGQLADGVTPSPYTEIEKSENTTPAASKPSAAMMLHIIKSPIVWLIGGFIAANAFVMGTMTTHQVSYVQDIGFDAMTAATTLSLLFGMSFIGSLSFGAMAMKMNVRLLALIGFCIELFAIILLLTSQQITMIYIYAMLIGLGNGALMTAMPTFVGRYFHGPEYTQAFGIILPFQIVSQSLGAFTGGAVYDATASYSIAFYILAGVTALGFVCVSLIKLPKKSSA